MKKLISKIAVTLLFFMFLLMQSCGNKSNGAGNQTALPEDPGPQYRNDSAKDHTKHAPVDTVNVPPYDP